MGEITNWSELGGEDAAIVVIGRESGSGTRDAFEELNEIKDVCNYAQELDSTGAVLAHRMCVYESFIEETVNASNQRYGRKYR